MMARPKDESIRRVRQNVRKKKKKDADIEEFK